jgi:CubicO group peptidase (beta-lactamase class C family)
MVFCLALGPGRAAPLQEAPGPVGRIDRLLEASYAAGAPGASVLIARGREVVLRRGYGLSNLEHDRPATPETVFRIASLTKIFTAAAILALVDRGRLGLEDPVTAYLDPMPWPKGVPAIRDLLGHTSGVPDYLDRPDSMRWARDERTLGELISAFKDRAPDFAPGERNAYSNSNYILLGAVLERVTGKSLAEALRELVLEPLGLRRTHYDGESALISGRASGYEPARGADGSPDGARFRNVRYFSLSSLNAAGGMLSTVDDLHALYRGMVDGRIFRPETLAKSLEPVHLSGGQSAGAAVGGWQIERLEGRMAYMKGGSLPGTCAWILFVPQEDLCVVLLSNRSAGQPRCGALAIEIARLALGPASSPRNRG